MPKRPDAQVAMDGGNMELPAETYRTIIENLFDTVFVLDRLGRFTYISPPLKKCTGFTPNELAGESFKRVIPSKWQKIFTAKFRASLLGKQVKPFEVEMLCKSGAKIPLSIACIPLKEGKRVERLICVSRDITELKRGLSRVVDNYNRIKETNDAVEARLAERTVQLKKTVERLAKQQDELKRYEDVTIGRELRMVELKKEIKECQTQLKDIEESKKAVAQLTEASRKAMSATMAVLAPWLE